MTGYSRKEVFDLIGNDPVKWYLKAITLLDCGATLTKTCPALAPLSEESEPEVETGYETLCVILMLRAMAIECLLTRNSSPCNGLPFEEYSRVLACSSDLTVNKQSNHHQQC